MTSRGTPDFWLLYRGLPAEIRDAAREAHRKFLNNPAHPGLQLERLRYDQRIWSVRVTKNHRAVVRRHGDDWLWFWIGTHRDFDARFPR